MNRDRRGPHRDRRLPRSIAFRNLRRREQLREWTSAPLRFWWLPEMKLQFASLQPPIAVGNTSRSQCNSSISADQQAEDGLRGPDGSAGIAGHAVASGRPTALKLDSML